MKKSLLSIFIAIFLIFPEISRADGIFFGGSTVSRPLYEGSNENEFDVLPFIDISLGDSFYINNERGLGFYFIKYDKLEVGGGLGYYESRNEEDSTKLNGFDDIDGGIDGRMFVKYNMNRRTSLSFLILNDISDNHSGALVNIGATFSIIPKKRINWSIGASTSFADDNYMQTYFDVTQSQINQSFSSSAPFVASGGWKDFGFNTKFAINVSPRWKLKWHLDFKRLTRAAAYSPLVRELGSPNQFQFGIGVAYDFSGVGFRF
jgi:MipA family protein